MPRSSSSAAMARNDSKPAARVRSLLAVADLSLVVRQHTGQCSPMFVFA
jgi:hypothetical protein